MGVARRRGFSRSFGWVACLLVAGLLAAPGAQAQSSTGGCFAPCDTAFFYLSQLGYVDFSSNPRICRAQCAEARKGCNNAVTSAARCVRGSVHSFFAAERFSCNDGEGSSSECVGEINAANSEFDGFLQEDLQCGFGTCQDFFEDCVLSCDGGE